MHEILRVTRVGGLPSANLDCSVRKGLTCCKHSECMRNKCWVTELGGGYSGAFLKLTLWVSYPVAGSEKNTKLNKYVRNNIQLFWKQQRRLNAPMSWVTERRQWTPSAGGCYSEMFVPSKQNPQTVKLTERWPGLWKRSTWDTPYVVPCCSLPAFLESLPGQPCSAHTLTNRQT